MHDTAAELNPPPELEGLRGSAAINTIHRPRLHFGTGADGIERLEASLIGEAFSPHRHDRYAIGITLRGVQTFQYRGERHFCLPGDGHILHPDETHDGAAGTDQGFGYRIIYLDPALVRDALGGASLPFVADPVIRRRDVDPVLVASLADLGQQLGDFVRLEIAVGIANMLRKHSGTRPRRTVPLPLGPLARVRDMIADDPTVRHSVAEFEGASGLDRWTIARQFRAAYGTSPTRFRTMRQLDRARALLRARVPIATAALDAGFADQSHLSRMFKQTYGLTPARWAAALG